MESYEKIKILWIEDLPDEGHPPRSLGTYSDFFEVAFKDDGGRSEPVKSIEEFNGLLRGYLDRGDGDKSVFPVEIVASDYDLSKHNSSGHKAGTYDVEEVSDADEGDSSETDYSDQNGSVTGSTDFDGFLIASMYAAHFRLHPTCTVATTYQSKRMGPTVKQMENTLRMCYGADIKFAGTKRSWDNIIKAGVAGLRERIENLNSSRSIVISPSDLLNLVENPAHEFLALVSHCAARKFPIRGLFADVPNSERNEAIRGWATKLIHKNVDIDAFRTAKDLAGIIWSTYNNDALMDERRTLSELHSEDKKSSDEYKKVRQKFDLARNEKSADGYVCKKSCFDIRSGGKQYSKEVRRIAALLLIRWLLKRVLTFMRNMELPRLPENDLAESIKSIPTLDENDIYLLLFPVPPSPLILPWHSETGDKTTWYNWLKNNLNLMPSAILQGKGISGGERQLLQGMAMDEDKELGDRPEDRLAYWKTFELAKKFLFGA